MSLSKPEPVPLFRFESPEDVSDIWCCTLNDPKAGGSVADLAYCEKTRSLSVSGLVRPTMDAPDFSCRFGFANLQTRTRMFYGVEVYPIIDLIDSTKFEIRYCGPDPSESHLYAKAALFNLYMKPSIISMPVVYQAQIQILPGWNRLILPLYSLEQVRLSANDLQRPLEANRVCMLGINFVSRDVEIPFKLKISSIHAYPDVNQYGGHVQIQPWEVESKIDPYQIPMQSMDDPMVDPYAISLRRKHLLGSEKEHSHIR